MLWKTAGVDGFISDLRTVNKDKDKNDDGKPKNEKQDESSDSKGKKKKNKNDDDNSESSDAEMSYREWKAWKKEQKLKSKKKKKASSKILIDSSDDSTPTTSEDHFEILARVSHQKTRRNLSITVCLMIILFNFQVAMVHLFIWESLRSLMEPDTINGNQDIWILEWNS